MSTKTKTEMEYLFDQTSLTKRQCHCYGCGLSLPTGSRVLKMLAVKLVDRAADYVFLRFCRICRQVGRSLTGPEWRSLQPGQLRAAHRDEWAALDKQCHPSTEVPDG